MVRFEKVLGAVKVIKDQIQYRSQSLLNLARDYFSESQPHSHFTSSQNCFLKVNDMQFLQELYSSRFIETKSGQKFEDVILIK